jgi:hypothetical protein
MPSNESHNRVPSAKWLGVIERSRKSFHAPYWRGDKVAPRSVFTAEVVLMKFVHDFISFPSVQNIGTNGGLLSFFARSD